MKVVINKCYGGFGLSIAAKMEINKLNCAHSTKKLTSEYYKRESFLSLQDHCKCCEIPLVGDFIISDEHRDDENRTCLILVKIVEKMGKVAYGRNAELTIVEIPDDVEFTIEEDTGIEHVAEKHRTWS